MPDLLFVYLKVDCTEAGEIFDDCILFLGAMTITVELFREHRRVESSRRSSHIQSAEWLVSMGVRTIVVLGVRTTGDLFSHDPRFTA